MSKGSLKRALGTLMKARKIMQKMAGRKSFKLNQGR